MSMSMSMMSSIPTATSMTMSATGNISAAEYTITALPAVQSQPSCIFNCLIPIGLADPSGCDDVTNECACLIAPDDALEVLTGCIQTVCQSSTSTYAIIATSLYESYCQSVFGAAEFSEAFAAESSAAAVSMTMSMSSTAGGPSAGSMTATTTPSVTAKSASVKWTPSWYDFLIQTKLLFFHIGPYYF